jgi:hypothetical protein
MFDSAYSPSISTTDAEIQRKLVSFQSNANNKARRANADYAATERDASEVRRANADYAATERDASKVWRANADYAATKRDATKVRRGTMPPPNARCE